uniref:senescence-induced receptor-like serine/threonine-protein kinase n=1 Tax=Erigeron canadensis TaxID=72917 RepID=UPI001CB926D4|nr:senescence-induced receptor-like serine/threonine-protein kinase [Erigeron canadensis]
MTLFKSFYSILLFHVALFLVVHAEDDQSGFLSIDCGLPEGSDYTDAKTGIKYVSDVGFTEGGIAQEISPEFKVGTDELHLTTLRFFPESNRSCYTIRPKQGKNNTYLIRARFNYGNYDHKGQPPIFNLYLGTDFWQSVYYFGRDSYSADVIHHLALKDYIKVCLVNTGQGIPFISALEVRLLDSTMYEAQLLSLILLQRRNFGSDDQVRYKDDKFDRIWEPVSVYNSPPPYPTAATPPGYKVVKTSYTVPSGNFYMPSKVMSTAITPINSTENILYPIYPMLYPSSANINANFRIYLHFAEVETLKNNTREFRIYLNGNLAHGPVSPTTVANTIKIESHVAGLPRFMIELNKTHNSTLPPLINAIEVYAPTQFRQEQTEEKDDAAISNAKSMYGLKKNWQGDPCLPKEYAWDGLTCRYNNTRAARIISLNLSSSNLSGQIANALGNLTMLESLDLSYNNLTGTVPDFLAKMKNLRFINLRGNHFSGPLPPELLAKSNNGSLMLSIEEKSSCIEGSCKNKRSRVLIGVIAAISVIFVLLIVFSVIWTIKKCQTKDLVTREEAFRTRNQKFTYSEVKSITNNFKTQIGIGGFGEVFQGSIGNMEVAVKILLESSKQGYKEFLAEVKILMDVRHKNITPLIGYCDDKNHKAIIYEYMANGNLGTHLFDASPNVLSWERRLQIGCDAAEGLAYMHHGCTPSIVHRDIKSSNILLNEGFEAKLADFGLSRAFATVDATHVATTRGSGTPGYLDPEYHSTSRLTEKSDVYSFGIVLLELITGRRAISWGIHIVFWVESTIEEGSVENIIDPRLQGLYNINIAWKVFELAKACVSPTSIERPTMNEVVIDLKQCLQVEKSRHGCKPNNQSQSVSLNMESMSDPKPR